jgi:heptosyltransferase-3
MTEPRKILAINFKFLGDVVVGVPGLRAIHEHFPKAELHVLVAEEAAPLLRTIPWITRVWGMPRVRGKATVTKNWPFLRALRKEKFDRSVDFAGNDRGAFISLLCGAKQRLGPIAPKGFWGRRFCYTQRVEPLDVNRPEVSRVVHTLKPWGITARSLELELHVDPKCHEFARALVPEGAVIAHVTTSQPKKEWPLPLWATFYEQAIAQGLRVLFAAGPSARDQGILNELRGLVPGVEILPPIRDLSQYLSVLSRARVFVTGDTGPLHFAVALKVPTVSLFGPSHLVQWRPMGEPHQVLCGVPCQCPGHFHVCDKSNFCMRSITPLQVMSSLQSILKTERVV